MRYAESDLVIPTLEILLENPKGVDTTFLIKELEKKLQPEGKDLEILANRKDTYFSQKVRNLKSHNTLTRKGLALYREGVYILTQKGKKYLQEGYGEIVTAIRDQGFNEDERNKEYEGDYKDLVVEEGTVTTITKNVKIRKRSHKLVQIARKAFSRDGRIPCRVCQFDFEATYGAIGKNYIEIHHTKPIHLHDQEGERRGIDLALALLAPLCSNCHRMVHKNKDIVFSIEELQSIVQKNLN